MWLANGSVTARLTQLPHGLAAIVAQPGQRTSTLYPQGERVLVSRPTPTLMRPSLGFWSQPGRVAITVQARKWRDEACWLVLESGVGAVEAELPLATIEDVLDAAPRADITRFRALVNEGAAAPVSTEALMREAMEALGIPHADVLARGELPSTGRVVEPKPKAVRRFEKNVLADREEQQEVDSW